jgi:predicted amidophosphoribosyltransferase
MDISELDISIPIRPEEYEEKGFIRSIIKDDFYPGLEIVNVSPKWYYNQVHHSKDEYSKKILQSKKGIEEQDYFKPYVEKCLQAFEKELNLSDVDLVTLIPNSNNGYYKSIVELVKFIASKFNKSSFPVFVRQSGKRTGNHREDRYKDLHGKINLSDAKKIQGKNILLVDDIRTSGISILECSSILLSAGAKKVVSLSLGTHNSDAPQ